MDEQYLLTLGEPSIESVTTPPQRRGARATGTTEEGKNGQVKGEGQIWRFSSCRPPTPVARWRASQWAVPRRQYTRLEALLVSYAPVCRAGARVVAFRLCDSRRWPLAGFKSLRNGRVRIY